MLSFHFFICSSFYLFIFVYFYLAAQNSWHESNLSKQQWEASSGFNTVTISKHQNIKISKYHNITISRRDIYVGNGYMYCQQLGVYAGWRGKPLFRVKEQRIRDHRIIHILPNCQIAIFKFLPLLPSLWEKARGKFFNIRIDSGVEQGGRFALHITRTQSLDWVNFDVSNIAPLQILNLFQFSQGLLWEPLVCNFDHIPTCLRLWGSKGI